MRLDSHPIGAALLNAASKVAVLGSVVVEFETIDAGEPIDVFVPARMPGRPTPTWANLEGRWAHGAPTLRQAAPWRRAGRSAVMAVVPAHAMPVRVRTGRLDKPYHVADVGVTMNGWRAVVSDRWERQLAVELQRQPGDDVDRWAITLSGKRTGRPYWDDVR